MAACEWDDNFDELQHFEDCVAMLVHNKHCDDYDKVLDVVRMHGLVLYVVSERLRKNRDIVMAAVGEDGYALQYVSKELRDDPDVVVAACATTPNSIELASARLRDDAETMKRCFKAGDSHCGDLLRYASARLRDDYETVLAAVERDYMGQSLFYASMRLRSNREYVMAFVNKCGGAFGYASDALRDDREVALIALRQSGRAVFGLSERLQDDEELVRIAITNRQGYFIKGASARLLNDRDFAFKALEICGLSPYCSMFSNFSEQLRNDIEFVTKALRRNCFWIYCIPNKFHQDEQHVGAIMDAVSECGMLFGLIKTMRKTMPEVYRKMLIFKRAWIKTRWPRLVWQALKFHRQDCEYRNDILHPDKISELVQNADDAMEESFEDGIKNPGRFWVIIMDKRSKYLDSNC